MISAEAIKQWRMDYGPNLNMVWGIRENQKTANIILQLLDEIERLQKFEPKNRMSSGWPYSKGME